MRVDLASNSNKNNNAAVQQHNADDDTPSSFVPSLLQKVISTPPTATAITNSVGDANNNDDEEEARWWLVHWPRQRIPSASTGNDEDERWCRRVEAESAAAAMKAAGGMGAPTMRNDGTGAESGASSTPDTPGYTDACIQTDTLHLYLSAMLIASAESELWTTTRATRMAVEAAATTTSAGGNDAGGDDARKVPDYSTTGARSSSNYEAIIPPRRSIFVAHDSDGGGGGVSARREGNSTFFCCRDEGANEGDSGTASAIRQHSHRRPCSLTMPPSSPTPAAAVLRSSSSTPVAADDEEKNDASLIDESEGSPRTPQTTTTPIKSADNDESRSVSALLTQQRGVVTEAEKTLMFGALRDYIKAERGHSRRCWGWPPPRTERDADEAIQHHQRQQQQQMEEAKLLLAKGVLPHELVLIPGEFAALRGVTRRRRHRPLRRCGNSPLRATYADGGTALPPPSLDIDAAGILDATPESSTQTRHRLLRRARSGSAMRWTPPRRAPLIVELHPPALAQQRNDLAALLTLQSQRCAGCGRKMSVPRGGLKKTHNLCYYYMRVFCACCHQGNRARIPAQILHNWNFKEYPVSDTAHQLLKEVEERPLFDLEALNPDLYARVKALRRIRALRIQLSHMWQYIDLCASATKCITSNGLLKTVFVSLPRRFLALESVDCFSLLDFDAILSRSLQELLEPVAEFGAAHIEGCIECQQRAFFCQVCRRADDPLFPFQLERVHRCEACGSLTHLRCWRQQLKSSFSLFGGGGVEGEAQQQKCAKCERLRRRREALESSG